MSSAGAAPGSRLDRWRNALLLPGETDAVRSVARELSEYLGLPRQGALERCHSAVADSRAHWLSRPRRTAGEIADFYESCESYLFEHMHWHATFEEGETLASAAAVDLAARLGARRVLDYGGGVGTAALMFSQAGFDVAQADISGRMLEFCRWRFERRSLPRPRLIDLRREALPEGFFDLALVVDVLEHVPDPLATIEEISRSLSEKGVAVVALGFGADPDRPMHIIHTPWRFLAGARSRGLSLTSPPEMIEFPFIRVYKRVRRGMASRVAVRLLDEASVAALRGARAGRWLASAAIGRLARRDQRGER